MNFLSLSHSKEIAFKFMPTISSEFSLKQTKVDLQAKWFLQNRMTFSNASGSSLKLKNFINVDKFARLEYKLLKRVYLKSLEDVNGSSSK